VIDTARIRVKCHGLVTARFRAKGQVAMGVQGVWAYRAYGRMGLSVMVWSQLGSGLRVRVWLLLGSGLRVRVWLQLGLGPRVRWLWAYRKGWLLALCKTQSHFQGLDGLGRRVGFSVLIGPRGQGF
jgi:hypothetical protein